MSLLNIILVVMACLAMITTASKKSSEDEELLRQLDSKKRADTCVRASGKCFNTAHCCRGLICAIFDEDINEKSEIPGNCVKSKDLQSCQSDRTGCPDGSDCVALGRAGQYYCVQHHLDDDDNDVVNDSNDSRGRGGLGASCESSKDCMSTTEDGSAKLCCQPVRRGRQGIKRLCDRVTSISECISSQ